MVKLVKFCLVLALAFNPVFTFADQSLDLETWVPIRTYDNPRVLYSPSDSLSDSQAILLTKGNDPVEFEKRLKEAIKLEGRANIVGSTIILSGVKHDRENETRAEFEKVIERNGFSKNELRVDIFTFAPEVIYESIGKFASSLGKRIKDFPPNMKRDFEKPQRGEVIVGILSTAAIEAYTLVYLHKKLPTTDFILTTITHTIILLGFVVLVKSYMNWLLRAGSSKFESFLKQMAVSGLFVANYNVMGRYSEIQQYIDVHGMRDALFAMPAATGEVLSAQWITLLLQAILFNVIYTHVIGKWSQAKEGNEESRNARTYREWALVPFLALDSYFLSIASGHGAQKIFDIGVAEFNSGHALLVALTIFGAMFYKVSLEPGFQAFKWFNRKITPAIESYLLYEVGVDVRFLANKYLGTVNEGRLRTRSVGSGFSCKAFVL